MYRGHPAFKRQKGNSGNDYRKQSCFMLKDDSGQKKRKSVGSFFFSPAIGFCSPTRHTSLETLSDTRFHTQGSPPRGGWRASCIWRARYNWAPAALVSLRFPEPPVWAGPPGTGDAVPLALASSPAAGSMASKRDNAWGLAEAQWTIVPRMLPGFVGGLCPPEESQGWHP